MNNRLLSGAGIALPVAAALTGCAEKAPERPNIIIMMTDDHTCRALSCYDSSLMHTPNLDRLAEEGMLFENCYVANAISGPSRACILTGKYSHANGFTDNSRTFDGDQQTFPKLLHESGYQTAMIGKWHLNSEPQGFDYWSILIGQGEYYAPKFWQQEGEVVEEGYVTDIITDKAISFIDQCDKERPFAMLYYHKAPHRNWMPAQRHLGIYNDHTFPEPATLLDDYSGRGTAAREQEMEIGTHMWPEWDLKVMTREQLEAPYDLGDWSNANVADVSRANNHRASVEQFKAAWDRMTPEEKARWDEAYAPRIEEWKAMQKRGVSEEEIVRWKYQQYMRDYCAVIKAVDENVGRLMAHLESIGELDNTIIIYTSDQGFFLGEHGWFDKRFMYEECHRTPLLVRYPKAVKAGTRTKALAMNIDFAPTLLEFAGVEIPDDIQGRSLVPVLTSRKGSAPKDWREAVYYHYYEYPSWHSVKRHYGIRTNDYKLIHFYNDVDEWELYDLREGTEGEMTNVYDHPDYADTRAHLHTLLQEVQSECGDTDPMEREFEWFKGAGSL